VGGHAFLLGGYPRDESGNVNYGGALIERQRAIRLQAAGPRALLGKAFAECARQPRNCQLQIHHKRLPADPGPASTSFFECRRHGPGDSYIGEFTRLANGRRRMEIRVNYGEPNLPSG
jgi:hypothetical protein